MKSTPLFMVSLATLGVAGALRRSLAETVWPEFGDGVNAVALVGVALGVVLLALFRGRMIRRSTRWLAVLPAALVLTAAFAFHYTAQNPFEPDRLTDPARILPELFNLAGYVMAQGPFFISAGVFLSFGIALNVKRTAAMSGTVLAGLGAGASGLFVLMYLLPTPHLVPVLLIPLAISAVFVPGRWRWPAVLAAVAALLASETMLLTDQYPNGLADGGGLSGKALNVAIRTPGTKILADVKTPSGGYTLAGEPETEAGKPATGADGITGRSPLTLYRDGDLIGPVPAIVPPLEAARTDPVDALPYRLTRKPRTLLIGAEAGAPIIERFGLGVETMSVIEPDPALFLVLRDGLGPVHGLAGAPGLTLIHAAPFATPSAGTFDVIDLVVRADSTRDAMPFTREALAADLYGLAQDGLISIPLVSPAAADGRTARIVATARDALLAVGVVEPRGHMVIVRSAGTARLLLSREVWAADRVAEANRLAAEGAMTVSWEPDREMDSKFAPDAADLSFDRRAVTLDRPYLSGPFHWAPNHDASAAPGRLTRAAIIGLIPVTTLYLISIVIAIILLLPLTRPGTVARRGMGVLPAIVHFPALALSFLFISAVLEEKVGLWLTDRTAAATLTPATMMICAGLSSMWAIRFGVGTRMVSGTAMAVILVWLAAALLGLDGLILGTLHWTGPMRAMLNVVVLIPVSIAFGVLFALRLARVPAGSFLLWVWSLTAACAALASPLARLLSWENGLSGVFLAAGVLIGVAILTFPPVYQPKEGAKDIARGVPNDGLGSEAPGAPGPVSST